MLGVKRAPPSARTTLTEREPQTAKLKQVPASHSVRRSVYTQKYQVNRTAVLQAPDQQENRTSSSRGSRVRPTDAATQAAGRKGLGLVGGCVTDPEQTVRAPARRGLRAVQTPPHSGRKRTQKQVGYSKGDGAKLRRYRRAYPGESGNSGCKKLYTE